VNGSPTAIVRHRREVEPVRLSRSRLALAQAELALETLRSMADDPVLFRAYFVASLAMLRRVGIVVHEETEGRHGAGFADWWRTTRHDALHVYVSEVRNPAVEPLGESGEVKTETTSGRNEAGTSLRWSFVSGPYAGSDALATLEEYLHWLERELVPGAERRTR
jgi:hypothetical protein